MTKRRTISDSIAEHLGSGGDPLDLPDIDELIEAVTFTRAAGIAGHQLVVTRAVLSDLVDHGAEALPRDLFDSDEDREQRADELRRHYAQVVELLSDEVLANRFDLALPADRLERELVAGEDFARRSEAMAVIENLDEDELSTDDLEAVAGIIRRSTHYDDERWTPSFDGHPSAEVLISFFDGTTDEEAWTAVSIQDLPRPWQSIDDIVADAGDSPAFLAEPFAHALRAMVEEASLIVHLLRVARGDV